MKIMFLLPSFITKYPVVPNLEIICFFPGRVMVLDQLLLLCQPPITQSYIPLY